MANIKFNIISKNNPSNLNIRFYHGKKIDCNAKSNLLIDPALWSNKMQNLKPSADKKLKSFYSDKIQKLRSEIIYRFNVDYSSGEVINSKWLNNVVESVNKRPKDQNDETVFFIPFIKVFINESKKRLNLNTGKLISSRTIQKYNTIKDRLEEYEVKKGIRFKIKDINLDFHSDYTEYLKSECKYSNTMIEKIISQIKTFLRDAKQKGYETNLDFESKRFSFSRDETIDTYLNEKEIEKVFKIDFSENDRLDNVRDLFIIGLRTGLRISDLSRVEEFQFTKKTILVANTLKTGVKVEIPIHPQVQKILDKRQGGLPKIISSQRFNEYVKEVCKKAGFTHKILGKLKNPETNRKEKGYFEKYKLISSHTCRRSFATNLYGKIDDKTIMAITGHKSHKQFMSYIKTTQKEHIERLAQFWKKEKQS